MTRADSPPPGRPAALALVGPTASGKSEVALALADALGGEIISVDSMQVYRGLDIGTAKPSAADRARVRHHLIDCVALSESFDAAAFVRHAGAALRDIQGRGRIPILCGGTGLYLKAFLAGLGAAPAPDLALRAELEAAPLASLLAELAAGDPATFARIDRHNARRVVRAVEVLRLTGRPFSGQRAAWACDAADPAPAALPVFGLARERADLVRRIEARVDGMFARGLVAETRALLGQGLERNRTALQALGYRQVCDHLRGQGTLAETVARVQQRTRQFARRQMTWFRRQLPVRWLDVGAAEPAAAVSDRVRAALRGL